jgi:hypothetical protein
MEAFDSIEQARAAKRRQDFAGAEEILKKALTVAEEPEVREELFRQLFYLYFSPVYENLVEAEHCLAQIDRLNPSAHNGMEWALFLLNCKQDSVGAKKWAEIAMGRAESENAISVLYTATAFAGLIAAKELNVQNVQSALRKLSSLVESGQDLPWGDEVTFLEASLALSEQTRRDVKALATQITPRIQDPEYQERAERLTHVD